MAKKERMYRKPVQYFPGGPVAKTPSPSAGGPGSIPGRGTRAHTWQLGVRLLQ